MKTISKLFFAPFLWLLNSCSPLGEPVDPLKSDSHFYNKDKSDIEYSLQGNWFGVGNSPMNADVESFEALTHKLSRDKNQMYFGKYIVENPNFDITSIYVKNGEFMSLTAFDTNNVYSFKSENYDGAGAYAIIIEKANPLTFQRIDQHWAKDGTHHFFNDLRVEGADYDSFEVVNFRFAKDKTQTFLQLNDGAGLVPFDGDAKTLENLEGSDKDAYSANAIDESNVYLMTENVNDLATVTLVTIPYTDRSTIDHMSTLYLKVDDSIYFNGKIIPGADTKTFEMVGENTRYGKDANHVYYESKVIENADAATFKKGTSRWSYKDKNGKYSEGKLVAE